jgi:hypothetical protein
VAKIDRIETRYTETLDPAPEAMAAMHNHKNSEQCSSRVQKLKEAWPSNNSYIALPRPCHPDIRMHLHLHDAYREIQNCQH